MKAPKFERIVKRKSEAGKSLLQHFSETQKVERKPTKKKEVVAKVYPKGSKGIVVKR